MHPTRILICGNYGAGNFGDELILQGLLKALKGLSHIAVTVMTANPQETRETYGVHAVPHLPTHIRSWLRAIATGNIFRAIAALARSDIILFGGGCLFNETESRSMQIWSRRYRFFWTWRKKYFIIGQSFGDFEKDQHRKTVQHVVRNAAKVIVRDHASRKRLEKLKVHKKIHVLADPALWLDKDDLLLNDENDFLSKKNHNEDKRKSQNPYALINARRWPSFEDEHIARMLETWTRALKKKGITPQGIALQRGKNGDEAFLKTHMGLALFQEEKENKEKSLTEWQRELIRGYGSALLVISMRLHGAIAAIITETPLLFVPYDTKISDLFEGTALAALKLAINETSQSHIVKIYAALAQAEEIRKKMRRFHIAAQESLTVFRKMLTKNI